MRILFEDSITFQTNQISIPVEGQPTVQEVQYILQFVRPSVNSVWGLTMVVLRKYLEALINNQYMSSKNNTAQFYLYH